MNIRISITVILLVSSMQALFAQETSFHKTQAYWSQKNGTYITSELASRGWIKLAHKHLKSTPIDSSTKNRVARVLFIGNSYTYGNNMPMLVDQMAASQSDTLIYYAHAVGGATFKLHFENPAVREQLRKKWDFVVLQGNSRESSQALAAFQQKTLPYVKKLDSLFHIYNPQGKTILFMTWGHKFGDTQGCPTNPDVCSFEQMSSKIRARYLLMRDSLDCWVAPVGVTWTSFRTNHPATNLYVGDNYHPNYVGSYLVAGTLYTTIFGKALRSRFKGELHESLAKSIQYQTSFNVLDSLDVWTIRSAYHQPHTSTIGPIPSENNNSKGLVLFIRPNPVKSEIHWNITPTPVRTHAYRVQIINAQGAIVLDKMQYPSNLKRLNMGTDFSLMLDGLPKGSYYFAVHFGNQRLSSPFIKL